MDDNNNNVKRKPCESDAAFVDAVGALVCESAAQAGWRMAATVQGVDFASALFVDAGGVELAVSIGRAPKGAHKPRRGLWAIKNRPRWRRVFCALQDRLFHGRVPKRLRPGCTSCGRVER